MDLGALRFLNAREVFPTEPAHFSTWVAQHLERLGDALGLELELVKLEAEVGPFSLDILARVAGTQDVVIIENQIEQTDHGHLGQVLTYAAGYDAKYIVWLSTDFREQHRAALDWLNTNTGSDRNFFGMRVEVLKIDDSRPAVHFRPIVVPNEWQKRASQVARGAGTSSDQEVLNAVFQQVQDLARKSGAFNRLLSPRLDTPYYVLERTHKGAVEYAASFGWDKFRAEAILNHAQPLINAKLFALLKANESGLQAAVQGDITWDFQERRKRQNLLVIRTIDRPNIAKITSELASWVTARLVELRRVLEPRIDADLAKAVAEAGAVSVGTSDANLARDNA